MTLSSNLWDLTYKLNLRWYIIHAQIHTFNQSSLPLCWRKFGMTGNLYYSLWLCNNIASFWNDIFKLITVVTGITIPPSPELALLSIGIENIPRNMQCITIHILLAARLSMVRHWKSPDHISIYETIHQIHTHTTNMNTCLQFQRAI